MEEKKDFDVFLNDAINALGHLMASKKVCKDQRAVMKINRFRAWLMDLIPSSKVLEEEEFYEVG